MTSSTEEKHTFDLGRSISGQKGQDHVAVTREEGSNLPKTSQDGQLLDPQPSEDPNDPLNWSQRKKNLILLIISATAFLPDYGSATGAVTLIPQAEEWSMTEDMVNHSTAGNVFMIGAGGIFVVAFAAFFGRLPVFFWFLVVASATTAWCAAAGSYKSFMTARILNGFFSTVAQGVSVPIKDRPLRRDKAKSLRRVD
ncbi:MAG: hypothetical protein Q9201_001778 [Fulgogasparrea decipioides]